MRSERSLARMHDWLAGIFHTIWLAGWPRTPGSPEMADGMALDAGWPPPPAAAPDPELRTIVGDGNQAATAAVPGAGAPFFAVLGLVPGRCVLKMEIRTVPYQYSSSTTAVPVLPVVSNSCSSYV